jgi:hypothetical protein
MSTRTAACSALTAAALLVPAGTAAAMPVDPLASNAHSSPVVVERAAPSAVNTGTGVGTLTVLVLAGGTLLAGAATGFGGGRVVTRRAMQS